MALQNFGDYIQQAPEHIIEEGGFSSNFAGRFTKPKNITQEQHKDMCRVIMISMKTMKPEKKKRKEDEA